MKGEVEINPTVCKFTKRHIKGAQRMILVPTELFADLMFQF